MSDIKIYVTHTPDSKNARVRHPLFTHVMAGSDFCKGPLPPGMQPDNTGDHISGRNREYCELTAQYWAWKNARADYYGFCHYRRYFSFAPGMLPQADCGCPVYPYLNRETEQTLCIKEAVGRIQPYDFLIAKGIPVRSLFAKDVVSHYNSAPGLHGRDLELFTKILCEKYPHLRAAAQAYLKGDLFYPCNMFIMKRGLFMEYAGMLFDTLTEFDRQADLSHYSREGRRTPGHLGERFAGIYYTWIRQQETYRTGELQMVLFLHTQAGWVQKAVRDQAGNGRPGQFKQSGQTQGRTDSVQPGQVQKHQNSSDAENRRCGFQLKECPGSEIPIVLCAGQSYVPVLYTCVQSIVHTAGKNRRYHIFIFHTDIRADAMETFADAWRQSSVRVTFVDVGPWITGYRLKAKEHITSETFYRFLIPKLLKHDPKAVYLDADVIVCRDIADLYDLPLGEDDLTAAACDPDFIGQYNGGNPDTREYCKNVLRLKNPYQYAQAGVLVLNLEAMRAQISVRRLFCMAQRGNYQYSDQDILNIVCQGRIQKLDMAWNVLADTGGRLEQAIQYAPANMLEEYEQARKQPYIIHYAGSRKPWMEPGGDFAKEFWRVARMTPYYEQLLGQMAAAACAGRGTFAGRVRAGCSGWVKKTAKKVLPKGSSVRRAVVWLYWKFK